MDKIEEWRPIEGYPNEVSNLGRVRSLFRGGCFVRKQIVNDNGYATITMQVGYFKKRMKVHRLVAAAFIGPIPEKMDVNHIDGNKLNNCVENLEYLTRSDNHRHAFKLGLSKSPFTGRKGETTFRAKLRDSDVETLRKDYASGISRRSLADRYGISYYTVWDITMRHSWTHI